MKTYYKYQSRQPQSLAAAIRFPATISPRANASRKFRHFFIRAIGETGVWLASRTPAIAGLRNRTVRLAQFLSLFVLSSHLSAQEFNYSLSLDTGVTYTSLNGATALSPGEKWLPAYEIPTGFSPGAIQQVSIETNGFVIYNKQHNSALMAFSGFRCKQDSVASWSQLSYLSTGETGSKILKIEYKNVGQGNDGKELLSYQVWIGENGSFAVLVGPGSYESSDTSQVIRLGLINRNMDTEHKGVFVSGASQQPVSLPLSGEDPQLPFLQSVPESGFKYTFTPNQN